MSGLCVLCCLDAEVAEQFGGGDSVGAADVQDAAGELKTAVHFTSWLASRGLDPAACRQPDLDTYLLACPARRDEVRHFLGWGRRYRDRALTVAQAPRPDTTVPLAQDQRWAMTPITSRELSDLALREHSAAVGVGEVRHAVRAHAAGEGEHLLGVR
jgi:hypothetical protein